MKRSPASSFDWTLLRQRLERARAAAAEALDPSPERARAIMDERARRLAHVPTPSASSAELELLEFGLGSERYALESKHVREVLRMFELTPVPGATAFVLGIVNLRGEILVVVDLRVFLGLERCGISDLARVVVLGIERPEFGVFADRVHGFRTIPIGSIRTLPDSITSVAREHLVGITDDALAILDGARLLADPRLFSSDSDRTRPF